MLGVEIQFDENRTKNWYRLRNMQRYETYLISFFNFYANFDFDENVIDLHSGNTINSLIIKIIEIFQAQQLIETDTTEAAISTLMHICV